MVITTWGNKPAPIRVPYGKHLDAVRAAANALVQLRATEPSTAVTSEALATALSRKPSNVLRTIRDVPGFVTVAFGRSSRYYYVQPPDYLTGTTKVEYPESLDFSRIADLPRSINLGAENELSSTYTTSDDIELQSLFKRPKYRDVRVPALVVNNTEELTQLLGDIQYEANRVVEKVEKEDLMAMQNLLVFTASAYAYLNDKDKVR